MSHPATWQISEGDFPSRGTVEDQLHFLLRYAVLAPSSHNSQPWRFRLEDNRIDIFLDYKGWLKVADDDQRELHISVGCALENLLVAAEHFGFHHSTTFMPDSSDVSWAASVVFRDAGSPSSFRQPEMFQAITARHTNHKTYESRNIPIEILERLEQCCIESGLSLYLTVDDNIKERVDELVVRGDAIQFSDQAYRDELGYWIDQGVFGTSWLMSKMGKLAVTHLNMARSQAKKDSALLMSSPVLGVFCTLEDDRASQIQVGQAYERLCLLAAAKGIWTQPISQVVQVPELKKELRSLIPIMSVTPQHPFRMGYAKPEKHRTPRKPVEDVVRQS